MKFYPLEYASYIPFENFILFDFELDDEFGLICSYSIGNIIFIACNNKRISSSKHIFLTFSDFLSAGENKIDSTV
jgi:hypothetical protein